MSEQSRRDAISVAPHVSAGIELWSSVRNGITAKNAVPRGTFSFIPTSPSTDVLGYWYYVPAGLFKQLLRQHCRSSLVTPHSLLYTSNAFTLNRRQERLVKLLQPVTHQGRLNAEGFRFAVVASRWNDFLTSRLIEGALDALERLGAKEKAVELFRVPGSFEIPLLAKRLAASGKWDAVVCVGTVIRGETPHFEYIAAEVTKGIAQAAMETGVPVVYGIVTADTLEQAIDRAGVKAGNKGFEAAMSAVELVNLYREAFKK